MGRRKFSTYSEQDSELLLHIESLGLKTVEEYRLWCLGNGFSCKLKKDWRHRCREREAIQQANAQERIELGMVRKATNQKHLDRRRWERRNPVELLTGVCEGRLTEDQVTQPHLKRLSHVMRTKSANNEPPSDPQALLRLLLHLHSCRVKLFDSTQVIAEFGVQAGNSFIEALALAAAHYRAWQRPCDIWKPRTHNARRQFASLLRHLFVRHNDMPLFFDSVWCAGQTAKAAQQRKWFLHVGEGHSIRVCDLPIPFTKRMAHHFKQGPSDLTVENAIRWSQVLGLGGDERLARAIIGSRLGENFEHDDFWVTVIEWFISYPKLNRGAVGPIVDYLQNQRFAPDPFVKDRSPPQPNLTMKGRTPESLLRKMHGWHGKLATDKSQKGREWATTGIDGFEFIEGSQSSGSLKIWTIREVLSSTALIIEGRQMRHCVAIYGSSCARGDCSIWTMELETFEGRTKLLTIEIRSHKLLICQARGKANRMRTERERGVLRRWAAQAGLTIASSL